MWKSTISFLDDCVVSSRTVDDYIERLWEGLQRFKDATLKMDPLNVSFPDKIDFFESHC